MRCCVARRLTLCALRLSVGGINAVSWSLDPLAPCSRLDGLVVRCYSSRREGCFAEDVSQPQETRTASLRRGA